MLIWILNPKEFFQTMQYCKTCWSVPSQYIFHFLVLFPEQFSKMWSQTPSGNHNYLLPSCSQHRSKTTSKRSFSFNSLPYGGNLRSWSQIQKKF